MNRKGIANQIIFVMIILISLAFIGVFFWAWNMFAPPAVTLIQTVSTDINSAAQNSGDGNLSAAVTPTLNAVNDSLDVVSWASYLILIMVVFGFILMCFYVRTYPFLIFFWVIGIIILAVLSLFMASAYQDATSGDDFVATSIKGWTTNHYIMTNMPMILTGIGIIGGIVMFILISREQEAESYI